MKIFQPTITGSFVVTGSATITGSLNVTTGITGSLLGTASFATTASYAANYVLLSQPSYSFVANNSATNPANMSTQIFVDIAETAYPSSSVVFTGTSAPTGIVSSSYQATQIGNTVNLWIWQIWTNASVGLTQVTALIPTGVSLPVWAGYTAANTNLYVGNLDCFTTTVANGAARNAVLYLRRNAAGNGVILDTTTIAATGARQFIFRIQYRTA